jgi:hypothetical protein
MTGVMADIIGLIYEDHDWLRRHFFLLDDAKSKRELGDVWESIATRLDTHAQAEEEIFYPALLKLGHAGDPKDETDDAVDDHNAIRDAVRKARDLTVGTKAWFEAVGEARTENGEHLDEEEREALPDFIKSSTLEQRHELAMRWSAFYAAHQVGKDVDETDKDPDTYIEENS